MRTVQDLGQRALDLFEMSLQIFDKTKNVHQLTNPWIPGWVFLLFVGGTAGPAYKAFQVEALKK